MTSSDGEFIRPDEPGRRSMTLRERNDHIQLDVAASTSAASKPPNIAALPSDTVRFPKRFIRLALQAYDRDLLTENASWGLRLSGSAAPAGQAGAQNPHMRTQPTRNVSPAL